MGPFTPGFVADHAVAEQFAEIGVILLLFGIGLRFHLRELVAVWRVAVPGALIQSTLSTVALALLLRLLGWSWTSGIILGMAISVASTVVMALVLAERHDLHAPIGSHRDRLDRGGGPPHGGHAAAPADPLRPAAGAASRAPGPRSDWPRSRSSGLVAVVVVLGRWVIPWALERIEKTRSRELFTLAVLVLAVGIAVGSAKLFGVSMALGAFLAGLAVGRSEFAARAAGDAVPMRDAFAVLFFVSVGMLFDPRSLVAGAAGDRASCWPWWSIGKPLAALLTVRALGTPLATAIPVGAAFSQVGEFSFILGTVARELGLIDDTGWNALVAASIISIALNPSIYRWARRLSSTTAELTPVRPPASVPRSIPTAASWSATVRSGRIVHRLLADRGAASHGDRPEPRHGAPAAAEGLHGALRRRAAAGNARGGRHRDGRQPDPERRRRGRRRDHPAGAPAQPRAARPRALHPSSRRRRRSAARARRVVAAGEAEVGVALAEAVTANEQLRHDVAAERRAEIRRRLYESAESG